MPPLRVFVTRRILPEPLAHLAALGPDRFASASSSDVQFWQRDSQLALGSISFESAQGVAALGGDPEEDPSRTELLSEGAAISNRVRYFADGLVIGSKRFVDASFEASRNHFGPRRKTGARKLQRVDTPLRVLRDLRVNPLG